MARRNSGPKLRFLDKRGAYYIVWTEGGQAATLMYALVLSTVFGHFRGRAHAGLCKTYPRSKADTASIDH